jgi:3-deoxy-manno-octulosonate cytidylyltransferase (CMP-KDO synthetase)
LVIIPSRLAATRLPNKPLADIAGRPMILHVVERALEADIGPVVVAADAPEIAEALQGSGATVVLNAARSPFRLRPYLRSAQNTPQPRHA